MGGARPDGRVAGTGSEGQGSNIAVVELRKAKDNHTVPHRTGSILRKRWFRPGMPKPVLTGTLNHKTTTHKRQHLWFKNALV